MKLVADTHVHIYDCYDVTRVVSGALDRLAALAPDSTNRAVCLVERHDCQYFRRITKGEVEIQGWTVRPSPEPEALFLDRSDGERLVVFAGRQIVTRERLEVLALTSEIDLPDGQGIMEVIERVAEAGGIPVLSWAPGKWFFSRGSVVRTVLERFDPSQVLLGDTTLRPTVWPQPGIMRDARRNGFKVLAGSDPLPFSGEEIRAGTFGITVDGFEEHAPVSSLRRLLKEGGAHLQQVGKRDPLVSVLQRLKQNRRVRT